MEGTMDDLRMTSLTAAEIERQEEQIQVYREHQQLLLDVMRLQKQVKNLLASNLRKQVNALTAQVDNLEKREEKQLENTGNLLEAVGLMSDALKKQMEIGDIVKDQMERQAKAIKNLAAWNKSQSIAINVLTLILLATLPSGDFSEAPSPQNQAKEKSQP